MGRRRSLLTSLVNIEGHGGCNMFISLDYGEGEQFFHPPEVEDGEEEEPPDILGQQGELYST